MLCLNVEMPRERSRLKSGAAKQPVIAISEKPFLAIEMFAMKSPMELPHAKTVKASKGEGNRVKRPKI